MTSPLRRKRPTTPRRTPRAKAPSSLAALAVWTALFYAGPASAGELKWRAPKLPSESSADAASTAAHAAETTEAPAETAGPRPSRSGAADESQPIRKVSHDQAEQEKSEGPRLTAAQQEQKEPRKLRSVVVRRSTSIRPLDQESQSQAAEDLTPEPAGTKRTNDQSSKAERPKRVLRDENVLRTAQSGGDDSRAWRLPTQDPFENDQAWKTRKQAPTRDRELRLARGDAPEQSTRSVLVRDPFEGGSGSSRALSNSPRDRFTSQPVPLDGADAAPQDDGGIPPVEGFRPFTEEPFTESYGQDRSLEAERERAERICAQALDVLQKDRINTIDLAIEVPGEVGTDLPFECSLDTGDYEPRNWPGITYMWKASALCHKPLYFENVALERYGHSWGWHVQPLVSAAHFFVTVPILPYKMGLETPNECIYPLGYYRPGNCAPYLIEPLGTSPRAVVWQAGAIVGASAIIP